MFALSTQHRRGIQHGAGRMWHLIPGGAMVEMIIVYMRMSSSHYYITMVEYNYVQMIKGVTSCGSVT